MENAVSRIPPNSLEAEQAILGSMMLSERCAAEVMSRNVREMDFYSGTHRRIWTAMTLVASSGSPIDLVTVTEQLERKEKLSLEQLTYLSDLTARVPATENISRYVDILKEKSTLRQLLDAAGRIADSVFAEDVTAQDALNNASQMIYSIAESGQERSLIKLKEALFESYAKIDDAIKSKDGILGISTGFPMLDKTLSGLQENQLIIVAGRTGMGKTSFALNIAEHVGVKKGLPVAIFSLEMSADQLATRLMCAEAEVDSQRVRNGTVTREDIGKLANALVPLGESGIYVDDTPTQGPAEMMAKTRRLRQREGRLGLVIIDYLGLMTSGRRSENRQLEIASMTRQLKVMARELSVPVMVLSQLSRATDKRESKLPVLSDLRESGAIEQDADVVLFVHRDDYYGQENGEGGTPKSHIIIAKQRSGPTGAIEVRWIGSQTRYLEVDFTRDEEGS